VLFRVLSFRQNRSAHGSVEPTNARVTEAESQPMPTSIDAAVPPPLPQTAEWQRAAASDGGDGGLGYGGRLWPLVGLLLKNAVLTILTLGIYRFWARTSVRRFFWAETRVLGDPLDYLGRGLELFLGFLIVIAILLPLAILLNVTIALLPPGAAVVANLIYFAVLGFLVNVAIYRARRYRLSRTAWRGVRAGQDGSSFAYALRAAGWLIVSLVTLGLAWPLANRALARYRIEHTLFGTARAGFDAPLGPLFRAWLPAWLAGVIALVALGWAFSQGFVLKPSDGVPTPVPKPGAGSLFVIPGLIAVAALVLSGWYRTAEARLFANHTSLAGAGLDCRLSFGRVLGLWLAMWVTAGLLVALVVGGVAFGAVALSMTEGALAVLPLVLVILLLLSLGFLSTIFMGHLLWRHATRVTEITNPQALEHVVAGSRTNQRFGEGLADALEADVGVF